MGWGNRAEGWCAKGGASPPKSLSSPAARTLSTITVVLSRYEKTKARPTLLTSLGFSVLS